MNQVASEQDRKPQQADFDFIENHPEAMKLFEDAMSAHAWALKNCIRTQAGSYFSINKLRVKKFKRRTLAEVRAILNQMIALGLCSKPFKVKRRWKRGRRRRICFILNQEPLDSLSLLLTWIRQRRSEAGSN